MTKKDFEYGEALLENLVEESHIHFENREHEAEIRKYCDSLIQEGTVDSISRLMLVVFQHDMGKRVIEETNWGSVLRLALNILTKEEKKEEALIFKVKNLDQLIYIFRAMRFMHYRWQLAGDERSKANLEALFEEFKVSIVAQESILRASLIQGEI